MVQGPHRMENVMVSLLKMREAANGEENTEGERRLEKNQETCVKPLVLERGGQETDA